MSVWTRYKYEKTQLSTMFQLKQEGGPRSNKSDNTQRQSSQPSQEQQRRKVARRGRPEMTAQIREQMKTDNIEIEAVNPNSTNTIVADSKESESTTTTTTTKSKNNERKVKAKKKSFENQSKLPAWALRHQKKEIVCPNCRNGGEPLSDPKAGRIVCTQCGLVLEVGYISEQSEWRSFADSDSSGPDPNRVGSAGHYLLNDIDDLSTKIDDGYLRNLQQSTTNSNVSSKLISAIRSFERIGRDMSLNKDCQNCAGEVFKDLLNCEELRSRNHKTKQAISMYLASKMCYNPRPFKEVCRSFGIDPKTVRKLHSDIQRLEAGRRLNLAKHRKVVTNQQMRAHNKHGRQSTIEVYAIRYASKLQCEKKMNKLLKKIVQNAERLNLGRGRQPTSIAAACVYMACLMNDNEKMQRSYKEVSAQTSISENTISLVYRRDLHPKRMQLIPDFADKMRASALPLR